MSTTVRFGPMDPCARDLAGLWKSTKVGATSIRRRAGPFPPNPLENIILLPGLLPVRKKLKQMRAFLTERVATVGFVLRESRFSRVSPWETGPTPSQTGFGRPGWNFPRTPRGGAGGEQFC